jgi:hypothetical protein
MPVGAAFRLSMRVRLAIAATAGLGLAPGAAAAVSGPVDDLVAFAPPRSQAALRGREVAARFELGQRLELVLQVNNAFAAQNRAAVARAESLIAAIPGVRKVAGPAGLLALTVDGGGRASAQPLLAGGPDDDASESVRQHVIKSLGIWPVGDPIFGEVWRQAPLSWWFPRRRTVLYRTFPWPVRHFSRQTHALRFRSWAVDS